ncbi:hypothetical protein DFH08DRAFT_510818, partial [Mycena albidolilacea]
MRRDGQPRFLLTPQGAVDERIIRVFRKLFVGETIIYGANDEEPGGLARTDINSHEQGYIYLEISASTIQISFSFPLQRGMLQASLQPPPSAFPDVFRLVTEVVKLFKPAHFTSPQRVDDAATDQPLEATYRHEFYRCLYLLRPRALISAEYCAQAPTDRIDFLVHCHESDNTARSWGIELLGDGDRLKDHTDHFDSEGVYRQTWVGGMAEFAIVDFHYAD